MSAWTPEPWRAGFTIAQEVVIRAEEVDGQPYVAHLLGDNTETNAARIVACVNLCQGIPTEAVEALQPGWWQRNAELLAAAVEVATWLEQRTEHYQGLGSGSVAAQLHAHANILRAAILRGGEMSLRRWKKIATGHYERWSPWRMEVSFSPEWGEWVAWVQGAWIIPIRYRTRKAAMAACEQEAIRLIQEERRRHAWARKLETALGLPPA
jgi:hypothetical protein